jgi:hypothetical protein
VRKDVRNFVARLNAVPGVEVSQGKTHLRVLKDGRLVTTLPVTPSDHRWQQNALTVLRRNGITPRAEAKQPTQIKPPRSVESMREALRQHWSNPRRGAKMDLARYIQQYAEANSLKAFASVDSANVGLGQFASGKTKKPAEWFIFLLEQALPHFPPWQGQDSAIEEEPVPQKVEGAKVTITIDLETIIELAAKIGVRLEIHD